VCNPLLVSFTVSRLLSGRLVLVCPTRALEQALEQTTATTYIMGTLHSLLLHCQPPPLVFGLTNLDKATAVALFTPRLPRRPLPAHVHSRRVLLPIDRDLLLILAVSQSR